MTVDATRTPRPLWRRAATTLTVALLIVVFSWVIWVKELHHTQPHVRVFSGLPIATGALASTTDVSS